MIHKRIDLAYLQGVVDILTVLNRSFVTPKHTPPGKTPDPLERYIEEALRQMDEIRSLTLSEATPIPDPHRFLEKKAEAKP